MIMTYEVKSADLINLVENKQILIVFIKISMAIGGPLIWLISDILICPAVKMHRCTVTSCRKIRRKDPGIVLYTLPDGAEKDPVWLSVLKYGRPTRWAPKKSTRICSDHFKMCDMDGRKLLPKAIPFREPVVFHPLNTGKILIHIHIYVDDHIVSYSIKFKARSMLLNDLDCVNINTYPPRPYSHIPVTIILSCIM